MRAKNTHRAVVAIAVWMLCAGVLFAADDLAPKSDAPAEDNTTAGTVDFDRADGYVASFRIPVILPNVLPDFDILEHIIRWDGRMNAGDILNNGSREDVVEPGDPCHEGGVGILAMCRE